MLIGIDVGGTFTDGVLFHGGRVLRSTKSPTLNERLEESIFTVLDELLEGKDSGKVERVVLSTTLVTNLLATGGGEKTALVLIPGPGLNLSEPEHFPGAYIVRGATDFRGRITEPLERAEVEEVGRKIAAAGYKKVAVVGKFSQRNDTQENEVCEILQKTEPGLATLPGFRISGQLNFLRRATTAYYTAMTEDAWKSFAETIETAIRERGIVSPIDILKADGGVMPLATSLTHPAETVFSGPAASTMGAYALTRDDKTSVVVDIGGTTTDVALILAGEPLYASRGATIGGRYTHIRAFATSSIALGGDSVIGWQNGALTIGPERLGPAACFGGERATPTDAVNLLRDGMLGGLSESEAALGTIAEKAGVTSRELAEMVQSTVIDRLEEVVQEMFMAWEEEPAYKIWEILNKQKVAADRVVGVGAAAPVFVPELAERLGSEAFLHSHSPVANALGAAVARPTLSLLLHVDTEKKIYQADIEGISGKSSSRMQLVDAKELAREELQKLAQERGIGEYAEEYEYTREEQFNMIRGMRTSGKLFDVGVEIKPGVIKGFKGVEE